MSTAGMVTLPLGTNPGAAGAGVSRLYFNASGQLCYVGNDGVEHSIAANPEILTNFTEQASAPAAPASGQLQLWSKTDNTLHIQNSSAVDQVLAILGAQTFTGLQTFSAGISIPTGQSITGAGTAVISGFASVGNATTLIGSDWSVAGPFRKMDPTTAAFVKTGAFTISTQNAILYAEVAGTVRTLPANTAVTMPSATTGTNYAIYICSDGTLRADANFSAPTGYTTSNSRKLGGFHYAPGGNAAAQAGGDTTPAINPYSIWDLKFRPACPDPRGMTLIAGGFWSDIYLLGMEHPTNGSSAYNVSIASDTSKPRIPALFGGDGSTQYGAADWWNMGEVLRSFGKRHPTIDEFGALAYGTTEAASATAATDPVSTILRAESTSKWGVMLSTGNYYVWGAHFAGPYGTAAWTANTDGRGSTYELPNAVLLGGSWGDGALSGSRYSNWNDAPTVSSHSVGARGVCSHYQVD